MKISDIMEAPIEDFQLVGDFTRGHSFRHATDRRLLQSPGYVQRIKSMFANTNVDFRMYFVNSPEASPATTKTMVDGEYEYEKREKYAEVGEVSLEDLQRVMPQSLALIQQQGGFGSDTVNIIFTNNSGSQRRPMTGWIIAHRLSHALLRNEFGRKTTGWGSPTTPGGVIANDMEKKLRAVFKLYGSSVPRYRSRDRGRDSYSYNQPSENFDSAFVTALLGQMGTMRSARENNLRTMGEFMHECFAQWLLTGYIKLNPAPEQIITGYAWGRPSHSYRISPESREQVDYAFSYIADSMYQEFDFALHSAVGRIFVM